MPAVAVSRSPEFAAARAPPQEASALMLAFEWKALRAGDSVLP